jgi:predicted ATPase
MEIATSLNDPDCQLVTLAGPGGIGKTRLVIQAALAETGSFEDGVYFIPSSDFSTPFLAETLGINLRHDADSQTQICDFLESKEVLLVLDGFEHLLDQVSLVNGWLRRAPHIRILVTSRERLNVSGELVLEVKGLCHTSRLNRHTSKDCKSVSPSESDAMQLFMTHAKRIRSGFVMSSADITAAGHICQLTQGMPLAIELAASWLHAFSPQEIAQEIQRDLDFLHSSNENVPARHRSLRAVFDASWALLSEEERSVFQRLSIFKNGWDLYFPLNR